MRRKDRDQRNFNEELMGIMHTQATSLNLIVGALNSLRDTVKLLGENKNMEDPEAKKVGLYIGNKVVATPSGVPYPLTLYGTIIEIADESPDPINPHRTYRVALKEPFHGFEHLWFDPRDLRPENS